MSKTNSRDSSSKSGPKPRFTVEDLINEAFSQGLDKFSLSAIAKSLHVAAPALYRLVESREHLLYLCFDQVLHNAPSPPTTGTLDNAIRQWSASLWDVCEQFSGLDRVVINSSDGLFVLHKTIKEIAGHRDEIDKIDPALMEVLETAADTVLTSHLSLTNWRELHLRGAGKSLQLRSQFLEKLQVEDDTGSILNDTELFREDVLRRVSLMCQSVTKSAPTNSN